MQDTEKVCVAVDAMGGDNAPDVILSGLEQALETDENLSVLLFGDEDIVEPFAIRHDRVEARPTTQVIKMGEDPISAVRHKRDSSIVAGCRSVRLREAQGFFSAGSTGACFAAAVLHMRRIKGIQRPAIASVIPTPTKPFILCDMGANPDCKPEDLVQFALMAEIYCRFALGREHPTIALLNNGSEKGKGSNLTKQAYELLEQSVTGFVGNAEGSDLLDARFDVVVTDGFTGNVALKALEGSTKTVFRTLKSIIYSSTKNKLGGAMLKSSLSSLMKNVNADAYGGAPLLGVDGICIIGHGSSNVRAVANAMHQVCLAVRGDLVGTIEHMAAEHGKR
jgi:glycerol-3-phosphate acyltransferase PlsX